MSALRKIWSDQSGSVISTELVLVVVVGLIGLLVAYGAVRDAVVSELSDVAGAVQDTNISYTVSGLGGPSSNVAGMGHFDFSDISDDADDLTGFADNFITMDVAPTDEDYTVFAAFGHATDTPARFVDSWASNMVVDEGRTFTAIGTEPISVEALNFDFHAGRSGSVITPFIVKVNGDNDFEVVAVGDTIFVAATGEQSHPFSAAQTFIDMDPGEKLAFGFLDANPDGSGSVQSIVRFDYSSNEIWYSGGFLPTQSGSVAVGSAPTPGGVTLTNQQRDYQFKIGLNLPSSQVPN